VSHRRRRLALGLTVLVALGVAFAAWRAVPTGEAWPASDQQASAPDTWKSTGAAPQDRYPVPTGLAQPLKGVQSPACTNASTGWLATERSRPGTIRVPAAGHAPPATNSTLQIYLDRTYAVCGRPVGVHLYASRRVSVVVDAIRVGDYAGGLSGRRVWTSAPLTIGPQRQRLPQHRRTEDNAWPTAMPLVPSATWPPGLYLVQVRAPGGGLPDALTSVYVQASGARPAYLAVGADLTQLAYNNHGGASLYHGPGTSTFERVLNRAYVASPRRALSGQGLTHLLTSEVPLAVMLDRLGISADWATDTSLDADPTLVLGRATIILPGHSEYWTRRNYDTLTYAVNHGTNLAVLGANEIYWQTRLHRDASGTVTSMTVYRATKLDPIGGAYATVQWRDVPLNRDPAKLTGLGMGGVEVKGDGRVVSLPSWIFAGSHLALGDAMPGLFGNEGDGPDRNSPANLQVLISSDAAVSPPGHHATLATAYYSRPGGAGVFHAGTTEWLCAALARCDTPPRTPDVQAALVTITGNVLRAFAAPKAGVIHPSTPTR
jgi:hypothetical protein